MEVDPPERRDQEHHEEEEKERHRREEADPAGERPGLQLLGHGHRDRRSPRRGSRSPRWSRHPRPVFCFEVGESVLSGKSMSVEVRRHLQLEVAHLGDLVSAEVVPPGVEALRAVAHFHDERLARESDRRLPRDRRDGRASLRPRLRGGRRLARHLDRRAVDRDGEIVVERLRGRERNADRDCSVSAVGANVYFPANATLYVLYQRSPFCRGSRSSSTSIRLPSSDSCRCSLTSTLRTTFLPSSSDSASL